MSLFNNIFDWGFSTDFAAERRNEIVRSELDVRQKNIEKRHLPDYLLDPGLKLVNRSMPLFKCRVTWNYVYCPLTVNLQLCFYYTFISSSLIGLLGFNCWVPDGTFENMKK